MKKKLYFIHSITILILYSSSALAADGIYGKIGIGAVTKSKLSKNEEYEGNRLQNKSLVHEAAIGYSMNPKLRLEIGFTDLGKFKFHNYNVEHLKSSYHVVEGETIVNEVGIDDVHHNTKRQDFKIKTYLFNVHFHPLISSKRISPYILGGVGIARVKVGDYSIHVKREMDIDKDGKTDEFNILFDKKTSNKFAWNIGAGISFKVNDRAGVDLEYKFLKVGSVSTKSARVLEDTKGEISHLDPARTRLKLHSITAALRIQF